jgi:hypothetical protein
VMNGLCTFGPMREEEKEELRNREVSVYRIMGRDTAQQKGKETNRRIQI